MSGLSNEEVATISEFLRERLKPEDLDQVVDILLRNSDGAGGMDADPEAEATSIAKLPRPGGAMDARRKFERENGLSSRPIRVLG